MKFLKMSAKNQAWYDSLEEADLEKLRNGYADMLIRYPKLNVSYEDFVLIASKVATKLHRKGAKADQEADKMLAGVSILEGKK